MKIYLIHFVLGVGRAQLLNLGGLFYEMKFHEFSYLLSYPAWTLEIRYKADNI